MILLRNKYSFLLLPYFFYGSFLFSQDKNELSALRDKCLELAYKNNGDLKMMDLEAKYYEKLRPAAFELPKTTIMYTQGQFNSIYKYDYNITASQYFHFPGLLISQSKVAKMQASSGAIKLNAGKADLRLKIREVLNQLQHLLLVRPILQKKDSVFSLVLERDLQGVQQSGKSGLEVDALISDYYALKNSLLENEQEINDQKRILRSLTGENGVPDISVLASNMNIATVDTAGGWNTEHPHLQFVQRNADISTGLKKVERNKGMPDFIVGVFNQTIYGPANIFGYDYFLTRANRLQGFQLGMTVPLFFVPHHARVVAAGLKEKEAKVHYQNEVDDWKNRYAQLLNKYKTTQMILSNFTILVKRTDRTLENSAQAFNKKEISAVEYLDVVDKALEIRMNYLGAVLQNNLAVAEIEYLLGR